MAKTESSFFLGNDACERREGDRVIPEAGLEPLYPIRLSFPLPSSAASALCARQTNEKIRSNSWENSIINIQNSKL